MSIIKFPLSLDNLAFTKTKLIRNEKSLNRPFPQLNCPALLLTAAPWVILEALETQVAFGARANLNWKITYPPIVEGLHSRD